MASSSDLPNNNDEEEVPEESERAVVEETEGLIRVFMYQRFVEGTQREEEESELVQARSDALEEIRSYYELNRDSNIARIGRRLGDIGDEIDARYKDQFQDMIEQLNLTSSTAYDTFASLARKLFRSGINWGGIVALLCFGYEIAKFVICRGFSGSFLRKIVTFVVDFIFRERIARWIARHGGWVSFPTIRVSRFVFLSIFKIICNCLILNFSTPSVNDFAVVASRCKKNKNTPL